MDFIKIDDVDCLVDGGDFDVGWVVVYCVGGGDDFGGDDDVFVN